MKTVNLNMSGQKYASRDAILRYIIENQDKYDGDLPLSILEEMWKKLGFAKTTIYKILKRMLEDDSFIMKEDREHVTKNKNKIPVVRYYINPAKRDVVYGMLGIPLST